MRHGIEWPFGGIFWEKKLADSEDVDADGLTSERDKAAVRERHREPMVNTSLNPFRNFESSNDAPLVPLARVPQVSEMNMLRGRS